MITKRDFDQLKKNVDRSLKQAKYLNVFDFIQPEYNVTFIIGARGVGKTISSLSQMIKKYGDIDRKIIYMRRYETEIETSSFDLDLISKLSGHEVTRQKVATDNGTMVDALLCDGQLKVYLLALSVAGKYKSNSFADVEFVIYDEFIDMRGRELKNETNLFLQFMMTVFRDFTKYHALFLANATNLYNNYFLDFEVLPTGRITKYRQLGIKIVMYQSSAELQSEQAQSILGKQVALLEGDDGSSLSNNFVNKFDDFIRKLDKNDRCRAILKLDQQLYGIWVHNEEANYYLYLSSKYDPSTKRRYAMRLVDADEDTPTITVDYYLNLRGAMLNNQLMYDNVKTRSRFMKRLRHQGLMLGDE